MIYPDPPLRTGQPNSQVMHRRRWPGHRRRRRFPPELETEAGEYLSGGAYQEWPKSPPINSQNRIKKIPISIAPGTTIAAELRYLVLQLKYKEDDGRQAQRPKQEPDHQALLSLT